MKNENSKKNNPIQWKKLVMIFLFMLLSIGAIYLSSSANDKTFEIGSLKIDVISSLEFSKSMFDFFLSYLCVTLVKEFIKERFKKWISILIGILPVSLLLIVSICYKNYELFQLLMFNIIIFIIVLTIILIAYHSAKEEKKVFTFHILFWGLVITLILNWVSQTSFFNWFNFFCIYNFNFSKFFSKYIFVSIIEILDSTYENKDDEKSRNQTNG